MLRLLVFIISLLAAGILLARLIDIPGYVSLEWMGWQIDTTPLFLLFVLAMSMLLLMAVFWFFDRLLHLPSRYRNQRRLEHHERGLSALTEAIAALSVSDISNAKKLTKRAEKLLGNTAITHLLSAQLARLEGNDEAASEHLKRLLDFKETHFLAARGLVEQARKSGDVETAVTYAKEAGSLRPDSSFAALSMIDLYTAQKRWQQALEIVRRAQKHRALTPQEARRFKALIEYQHAHHLYEKDDINMAFRYAKQAYDILPDMVPAALLLAEIYAALGKKRQVSAVISQTWRLSPHPDLLALFKRQITDQLPAKRVQLTEKLVAINPEDMESYLAIGEAALDAGDYVKARLNAKLALGILETSRTCLLIAQIEDAEQHVEKAEKWRERAGKSHFDPAWTCESCKETVPEWTLHCPKCESFDSIHWRVNRHHFVNDSTLPAARNS